MAYYHLIVDAVQSAFFFSCPRHRYLSWCRLTTSTIQHRATDVVYPVPTMGWHRGARSIWRNNRGLHHDYLLHTVCKTIDDSVVKRQNRIEVSAFSLHNCTAVARADVVILLCDLEPLR